MRIILNKKDINLVTNENGLLEYTVNGIKVEGFKRAKDALNHAEEKITEFIKDKYFKNA